MTLLDGLTLLNHVLVLPYGVILSILIAGGLQGKRQRAVLTVLCVILLAVQGALFYAFGEKTVRMLYPLVIHLPLLLTMVLVLKKPAGIAAVSVTVGYLCCQLPRWVSLAAEAVSGLAAVGGICYTVSIVPAFLLLRRWFVRPAHSAMTEQPLLFGSLPAAYYVFDYATAVYADALRLDSQAMAEFLPTALIVFYVIFLTAYHVQSRERANAQLQSSMLDAELKQSWQEMENLRNAHTQTAIYQHDMRHHLTLVDGYITAGNPQQASEYIRQVLSQVEKLTLQRFCEHEAVNLLCCSFYDRAQRLGVELKVEAALKERLPVPDAELCAVISNGLENAISAVSGFEAEQKWVKMYCRVKHGKLLLEIQNPCSGSVPMENGLPVAQETGHGYGCRSIASIAERHRGLYEFKHAEGLFTLRVVLPLE